MLSVRSKSSSLCCASRNSRSSARSTLIRLCVAARSSASRSISYSESSERKSVKSLLEEPPPRVVEASSLTSERADPRELVEVSDAPPLSDECVLRADDDELEEDDVGEGGGQERSVPA